MTLFLIFLSAFLLHAGNTAEQSVTPAPAGFKTHCDSATAHLVRGNFPDALRHGLAALEIAEQPGGNKPDAAKTHSLLGSTYYRLKEFDKALEHLQQAEMIYLKLRNDQGLAEIYYKKGIVHDELPGQQQLAVGFLRKALAIYQKENNCAEMADIYNALAGHYYMQRKTDSVVLYATQALQKFEECGTPQQQAAMYINIAALLNSQKRHREAITYNEKGIAIAAGHNIYPQLRQGYKNLSETYAYMNDCENAYANALLYIQYKDSVMSEEKSRIVSELTARYETERKEKLLAEKETEVAQTKLHRRILTLLLVFALALSATIYYVSRMRKRQNCELRLLNSTKDKLFSIISHDLKSPAIAQKRVLEEVIDNYEAYDTDTLRSYLQTMQKTSESQMELLQNLLRWAQLQTGRIKYRPRPFYVSEVVNNVAGLYRMPARNKQITLVTEIPDNCAVFADKEMITSVLSNLVNNAVKFSYPGSDISVSATCREERVKLSVTDHGTGMTAEQIHRMETSDVSFSYPGTQGEKGSGLGLAICKDLLEQNGSALIIRSSLGKGSEISFELKKAEEE